MAEPPAKRLELAAAAVRAASERLKGPPLTSLDWAWAPWREQDLDILLADIGRQVANLKRVDFTGLSVSAASLRRLLDSLRGAQKLNTLILSYTALDDATALHLVDLVLPTLPALREVHCLANQLTSEGVSALVTALKNQHDTLSRVTTLHLGLPSWDDAQLAWWTQRLHPLQLSNGARAQTSG